MKRPMPALLVALLLSACGDDEPGGAYTLVSVDGDQLPAVTDGTAITEGSVDIRGDSLVWRETLVFGYGTQSPQELFIRTASAYEVEGDIVRGQPEAVVIPDDMFQQCVVAGVYRLEDGGQTLRMIDMVMDGECEPSGTEMSMRTYVRR